MRSCHQTTLHDIVSTLAFINANIMQGFVVSPPPFVVNSLDLHPIHAFNTMMKYADDTYFLVGSNHIATATAEFANISVWAAKNNLHLNPLKTRELVITKRRHKSNLRSEGPVVLGAKHVSTLRVLGVVLQTNLSMGAHIDHTLVRCASPSHALCILRSQGLASHKLHEVVHMTCCSMPPPQGGALHQLRIGNGLRVWFPV